jgi:hypothetical protein
MWFTEYIEEIECDFAAIYGIRDMWSLDGPYFVRFASRLIYYEGAVQGKIKADYAKQEEEAAGVSSSSPEAVSTTKMSMSDAMKKYKADDLDILNRESESSMGGTLFERVSVPGN